MKRVKAACLVQTVHFELRDKLPHDEAVEAARQEYENYRANMDRNRTRYKILKEETQPDGSLLVELKRQYNYHDCGHYMD